MKKIHNRLIVRTLRYLGALAASSAFICSSFGFSPDYPGQSTTTINGNYTSSGGRFTTFSLDFTRDACDKLIVNGDASGSHTFVFLNLRPDPKSAILTFDNIFTVSGDYSNLFLYSRGVDNYFYHYDLVNNGNGTWSLSRVGPSDSAQDVVNSVGAMSIGWFAQLDNLNKRMGELRLNGMHKTGEFETWVRGYGSQKNVSLGMQGISTFREFHYGADFGGDMMFELNSHERLALGAFMGYQGVARRFNDTFGSYGDTDSLYGGLYATWLHEAGWYSDFVLKGQGANSEFTSSTDTGKFDTFLFGASLEFGRRFDLDDNWFIEGSGQFAYLHTFADNFGTSTALPVVLNDSDIYRFSAIARFGKLMNYGGYVFQPYVKAGIEEQLSSDGKVKLGDDFYRPNTDGTRGIFGAGVDFMITERIQSYFDYEAGIGDKYTTPWAVNLGLRVKF